MQLSYYYVITSTNRTTKPGPGREQADLSRYYLEYEVISLYEDDVGIKKKSHYQTELDQAHMNVTPHKIPSYEVSVLLITRGSLG